MVDRQIRLSAHIGYMFKEYPLDERFLAAARAGFDAVEHPHPYELPAETVKRLLDENGLQFSQLAVGAEEANGPGKGIAALAGRQADFREAFSRALDYAEAIGCPFLHPMSGMPEDTGEDTEEIYLDNLAFAASLCRTRAPSVLIEPISRKVVPGYYLHSLEHALRLTRDPALADILILLDTYHAAMDEIDAIEMITRHAAKLGHVHIADHPGRHEPGTGILKFEPVLDALLGTEYVGNIGFEYIPSGHTERGLSWLPLWKERIASKQATPMNSAKARILQ